jgi:hypothetical protein
VVIVDTLNGDPKGLKREEINNALQQALPVLAGCFPGSGGPASIALSFDAEPGGRASNIKVAGATPEAERCVSASVGSLRLPTFEGKAVPVQFPISLFKPVAPPTPAIETAPAAAQAAAVPATPSPSTTPYVPPAMPTSAGSAPPATDQIRTFIQP